MFRAMIYKIRIFLRNPQFFDHAQRNPPHSDSSFLLPFSFDLSSEKLGHPGQELPWLPEIYHRIHGRGHACVQGSLFAFCASLSPAQEVLCVW